MSRREVPSSSIASIVDFLMFFNNGKKCDINNAVIEKYKSELDLSEHPEYISKRYSDFYLVSINVVRKTQWTSEDFVELLDIFMEMESKYGSKGTQNSMLKRKDQWKKIKIKTVFQMGLCVLRDALGLDDDVPTKPNKFKLPIEFDIASYSNDIFELYDQEKQHFITSAREDVLEDFERQKNILTEDLYCEAPRKKAGGGRPSSKRTSFVRQLNKDRVFALLDENRITNWIPEVIEFIQLIEEKALPIPMDVGKYGEGPTCDLNKLLQQQKDGGCVSAGKTRERSVPVSAQKAHLKEQARVPEEEEQVDPDWGDDQADASGPYDPSRALSANKKRLSLSSSNNLPLKAPKPSSPEVPISPILPDKQRSATRHSGAQFKQTNDEFVDKYDACDPLNTIQGIEKPTSSSSRGTARNPALAKVSRQRLSEGMKKPVQSNRVPSKIDFDSVVEDDIENSDSDKEADNTDRKAVRTLLNLKQDLPKTEFPSTLLSPLSFNSSGKKTRKRDRDLASVRKYRRVIWTLEEEEALQDGVEIHGEGFWSAIRDDPKYDGIFNNRTNVNLKDKWRNMVKKGNRQATGTGNETHDNNE